MIYLRCALINQLELIDPLANRKHKMKKALIIILLIAPILGFGKEIDANKIEQREGIFYVIGKKKPFTGKAISYHENGKKSSSTEYKKGEIKGKLEGWYPTGEKQVLGNIINMQKTGMWTAWFQNGVKIRQGAFENGKEEGEYIWWIESGKVSKKGIYHNGISDGKWEWFYENGQKKQEGILRGETNDGIWKDWYENGKQKMVGSFKNGVKDGEWTWWDEKGNVSTTKTYKDGLLAKGTDNLDTYFERMEYYLGQKDFKQALFNIEKAVATTEDKTEENKVFMGLAVYHSKVYSIFQHLDEAETVLLKATGLSNEDIEVIVNSNSPSSHNDLKALAEKINTYPTTKTKVGPHITLALIYNILGDSINLQKEQQLMMERSKMSDWVINISMELYGIRATKENAYGYIGFIKEELKKEGETKENQLQLASYLLQIGQFKAAGIIADKYLKKEEENIDFLFIKTNIEMALGNIQKMKAYENIIAEINPKAFKK